MADDGLSRRRLLTAGVVVGAAPLAPAAAETFNAGRDVPWQADAAAYPSAARTGNDFLFFTGPEQAFITAACARIIPKDDLGPGAVEAGVPIFIDRQLAGAFGKADDWYMQGPWPKGEKTQGYQSRLNPAQLYRAAIASIDDETRRGFKKAFADLGVGDQDAVLKRLEAGNLPMSGGADATSFFTLFLQNVLEGYFADPLYGGNRDMVGWKLIGFSGARYDQRPFVKTYGQRYPLPPVAIMGRPEWGRNG